VRWSQYRVALGEGQIARAQELAARGERREALVLVRAGVARSPGNRDGRLLLARLLTEAGRGDAARQTLVDGLTSHGNDPAFLHPLFTLLLRQQRDFDVLAIARLLLPARPAATDRDRLLALAAATASFFRGDFDQADDFLNLVPGLGSSREGRLLAAKLDWARGYRPLALVSLRALAAERPHDTEVHVELVNRLRDAGRRDEARRLSLAFQIAYPALPGPRIELLRALRETGEHDRAAREGDAFLHDFAADPDALLALADFAANTADPALARRLLDHARAQNLPWEPHALLLIEAHIVARDYRAALDTADSLARGDTEFSARFQPVLNSLRAIAHFGLGEPDPGRVYLASYLDEPYLRAENLLAIAQRLTEVDAAVAARDALVRAIAADPLNQAALTRLVELDLNLNRIDELPAHLTRLVAMRQLSPDVLRVALHKLGSDLFLFSDERPAALAAVRIALDRKPPPRVHL
jgi:predicted Zn-dependent protease